MRAREMLNKIKWHPDIDPSGYSIVYLHRGAPDNERKILFKDIMEMCTSDFMTLDKDGNEMYIPYHRVLRILDDGNIEIWEKRGIRH